VVAVQPNALTVERDGEAHEIHYRQVRAVFDRTRIERGPGEKLLLQEKIKQGKRIFEKGSRQTISRVSDGMIILKADCVFVPTMAECGRATA
jgi:hypothetical protein